MVAQAPMNLSAPLVIVAPPPTREVESFGWGDFPAVTPSITYPGISSPTALSSSFTATKSCRCSRKRSLPPSKRDSFLAASATQTSFNTMDESVSSTIALSEDDESLSMSSSSSTMDVSDESMMASSSTLSEMKRKALNRRRVHFSFVEVQEYQVTLGDHPWANEYPLSLDWKHTHRVQHNIDDYEKGHQSRRPAPGTQRSLVATTFSGAPRIQVRRLSAIERKWRLIIVNNMSECELDDAEKQRQEEKAEEMRQLPNRIAHLSYCQTQETGNEDEDDYFLDNLYPKIPPYFSTQMTRTKSGILTNLNNV